MWIRSGRARRGLPASVLTGRACSTSSTTTSLSRKGGRHERQRADAADLPGARAGRVRRVDLGRGAEALVARRARVGDPSCRGRPPCRRRRSLDHAQPGGRFGIRRRGRVHRHRGSHKAGVHLAVGWRRRLEAPADRGRLHRPRRHHHRRADAHRPAGRGDRRLRGRLAEVVRQPRGRPRVVRATRREWIGLGVLALPTVIVTMDLSVLFLAVPKLTQDLQPTSSELLWITDVYGFLIAGSLITMGTIGDRIGRRRLLLIGGAAFALASLAAAFSSSAGMLIAARGLLGVAGATLAPSSLALIRNMFGDPGQRRFAIGVWISCFSAGAAIGPLVGGALLEHFWWGSVFLVNVPVMALLLAAGPALLPESRDPDPGHLDLLSAAVSLASVIAVIYGVTRIAEHGAGLAAALAIVVGVGTGVAFVRRQKQLAYPLIDLRLFRSPMFVAALGAMLVSVFVIAGADLFVAQYLQLGHGSSPFVAGLWLVPGVIALIIGAMVAPLLTRRVRPGLVVSGGLVLAAVGLIVLAQLSAGASLALLVA